MRVCLCVCVCVCARACACVCVCVCGGGWGTSLKPALSIGELTLVTLFHCGIFSSDEIHCSGSGCGRLLEISVRRPFMSPFSKPSYLTKWSGLAAGSVGCGDDDDDDDDDGGGLPPSGALVASTPTDGIEAGAAGGGGVMVGAAARGTAATPGGATSRTC